MVAPPFRSAVKIASILTILSILLFFFLACEMKGESYATVSHYAFFLIEPEEYANLVRKIYFRGCLQ